MGIVQYSVREYELACQMLAVEEIPDAVKFDIDQARLCFSRSCGNATLSPDVVAMICAGSLHDPAVTGVVETESLPETELDWSAVAKDTVVQVGESLGNFLGMYGKKVRVRLDGDDKESRLDPMEVTLVE